MLNKKVIQKVTFAVGLIMALGGWVNSASADVKGGNSAAAKVENQQNIEKKEYEEVTPFYYGEYKDDYIPANLYGIDYWLTDSMGTSHSLDFIGIRDYAEDPSKSELVFRVINEGSPKDKYMGFELYVDYGDSLQYLGTASFQMDDTYNEWIYSVILDKQEYSGQEKFYFLAGIAPDEKSQYYSDGYRISITNPYYTNIPDGWLNTGFSKRYYKNNTPYTSTWYEEWNCKYYFDENGNAVVNNTYTLMDKTYIFDNEGVMITENGWICLNSYNFNTGRNENRWYWGLGDGTVKTKNWVLDANNKWYYFDETGLMKTGWIMDSGKWYYLNYSGEMTTNWQLVDNKWYYMDSTGAMRTGWVSQNNKWYYLKSSGEMATGWVMDSGKWYYLNSNGVMATNWIQDGGKWYYLNSSGEMVTGWVLYGNTWYYLYSSGAMATNTVIDGWRIDGNGVARP